MYFSEKILDMKNIPYLLTIIILWLASSCSKNENFTLEGKIENLPSDTILVYYQVPQFQLDTIVSKEGSFTYTISPDTFTMFSLILNAEETIPVFADKGQTVNISGSINEPYIQGEGENKLMNDIIQSLKAMPSNEIPQKVDSFIQSNPNSFTTLYLLDKYYTRNDSADFEQLETLTKSLHGIIKDTPYMTQIQAKIETLKNHKKNQSILSLMGFNQKGESMKWSEVKDKHILLNFWASWHPQSIAERDSLKTALKEFKKDDLVVYNVSLDMDKDAWVKALDEETDLWKHICDFKGWQSAVVRNQNINQLPYTIILSPTKRILHRNLQKDEIVDKLKQLIKEKSKKKSK